MTGPGNPTARLHAQLSRGSGPWKLVLTVALDLVRTCAPVCPPHSPMGSPDRGHRAGHR